MAEAILTVVVCYSKADDQNAFAVNLSHSVSISFFQAIMESHSLGTPARPYRIPASPRPQLPPCRCPHPGSRPPAGRSGSCPYEANTTMPPPSFPSPDAGGCAARCLRTDSSRGQRCASVGRQCLSRKFEGGRAHCPYHLSSCTVPGWKNVSITRLMLIATCSDMLTLAFPASTAFANAAIS